MQLEINEGFSQINKEEKSYKTNQQASIKV